MVILKADPSLDKVYRKMIETAKEGVDWTGFFAVNNNMVILLGKTSSFIMDIDKKRVFSKTGSINFDSSAAIETADNKVLINIINMLLYVFGKWGVVNGLRVKQDYEGLSVLFSNILKEIMIQPYFNMSGLKFLKKGIQITFEEVVIAAVESVSESEEDDTIGLWHDLKWKVIRKDFDKSELKAGDSESERIGDNFYMVPYTCPECQNHLHMLVFPEKKEYRIDTDDGKIYLARVYACPSCNCFYTPRPDRLLKEGDVYYLEFEDDEKAAKDYRSLLGERGAKTSNCNFNMYESDYAARMQKRPKHLAEICRHLELLSEEEIQEILSKIDDGFFSDKEKERFLAVIEQELLYRQKMMEKKGVFGETRDENLENVLTYDLVNDGKDTFNLGGIEEEKDGVVSTLKGIKEGQKLNGGIEEDNSVIEDEKKKIENHNVKSDKKIKGINIFGSISKKKDKDNSTLNEKSKEKTEYYEEEKREHEGEENIGEENNEQNQEKITGKRKFDLKKNFNKNDSGKKVDDSGSNIPYKNERISLYEVELESENDIKEKEIDSEKVKKEIENNKIKTENNKIDSGKNKRAFNFNKTEKDENSGGEILEEKGDKENSASDKINSRHEDRVKKDKKIQNKNDLLEEKNYKESENKKDNIKKSEEQIRRELENLVKNTPDNISQERYHFIKEKLHQYKDIDIKPYEEYIDSKRDKVEKNMIDNIMTGLNGLDKKALKSTLDKLKEMELEKRNLDPVTDDIMKRIRRLDEEAVLDICPNVTSVSFDEGIEALERIREGDFLPDIKSDMIERIEKRLKKIKSDECEQLVHKFKRKCDEKLLDLSRVHFYDIRKMESGDNKDKESSLIRLAISTYAVLLEKYEYPIVICDSSMFESGKEGFIITPDHIFYKGFLKSGVIDVNNIESVEFGAKKGKGLYVKHNKSGLVKLPSSLNDTEEKNMAEVLDSFIGYLKEKPQSRSVEYLSQGSHAVKCCYRCGHIFSQGDICPKCGSRNN